MAKQGLSEGGLRVGVKGGGCSGLSYTFGWEREPRLGDEVFEGPGGTRLFVDRKSFLFLKGTTLDYDTALLTQGFVFHNPNAKQTVTAAAAPSAHDPPRDMPAYPWTPIRFHSVHPRCSSAAIAAGCAGRRRISARNAIRSWRSAVRRLLSFSAAPAARLDQQDLERRFRDLSRKSTRIISTTVSGRAARQPGALVVPE